MNKITLCALYLVVGLFVASAVIPVEAAAATRQTVLIDTVIDPQPVIAGQTATVMAELTINRSTNVNVEATVRDARGTMVWRYGWEPFQLTANRPQPVITEWPVAATLPTGRYTLQIGVRSGTRLIATGSKLTFDLVAPPSGTPDEVVEVLNLINGHRRANGLAPLTVNPQLTDAANWMARDMAEKRYFSHVDSLGRDPFQRMAAFGYTANTWKGENIAAGYPSAATVFAGWKESRGHNANMLNPNFTVIGIGWVYVAGSPYGHYWVTDFGGA